ncbi:NAD(P)/FAD-dependent oxidoreductase [Arcobacter roscoffensis]|uniref:FAD-dependent oxidoreductase n=1 Tax=Arcobacter roscoffensis TaxID=2961520 RepID=A0ABY5E4U6_9BACT|nr:FAD-dependent oxidoreductase [Arcobacter roscoffensis]UTJ06564.1 FAD-dependent oxidoreductase [Arcobacter roscoffensis]
MRKVIIIGASYAGLYAIKELSKNKDIEILLFDKKDYHYIQVESYGFVATKYSISDVTINISKYINDINSNIKFYKEEITHFDSEKKEVTSSNNIKYKYDDLIIATGALTNFPPQVPNIKKYSIGIKTLQKATIVNQSFDSLISKTVLKQEDEDSVSYNIVIGGAGLSGVEVASEMATLIREVIPYSKASNIKVYIVDGMKTVLPNMDKRLISACEKRLENLDVKTFLGTFIRDVDENKIYLDNGDVIDYNCFIFTGGIRGITIDSKKFYNVNKLNQYIVNEYLQLEAEENVFVIGDAAEIMYDNKYIPPTAQLAIQTGTFVAKFIKNRMSNRSNENFVPKSNGVLISLGGSYAIGLLFNTLFVKGYIAHFIKHFVTYMHKIKFKKLKAK